jgi:hypothetical protein
VHGLGFDLFDGREYWPSRTGCRKGGLELQRQG